MAKTARTENGEQIRFVLPPRATAVTRSRLNAATAETAAAALAASTGCLATSARITLGPAPAVSPEPASRLQASRALRLSSGASAISRT